MEMIADILLITGALGAGFYCLVLGRRLNRFNDLEQGVGGAVAILSAQVDDLNRTLAAAQASAGSSAATLTELAERAEATSRRLELQMASLHDITQTPVVAARPNRPTDGPVHKEKEKLSQPMFTRHREVESAA